MFILVYYIFRIYVCLGLLFSESHKWDELTSFLHCTLELHCNYILQFCIESKGMKYVAIGQLYTRLLLCQILTNLIQKK